MHPEMDSTANTPEPSAPPSVASVQRGRALLSQLQRDFALHFVLCGGRPRRAAILAGYAAGGASISAHRNLVNPRILAEIKRLSVSNIQAALPVAIRVLIEIASDPKADARARVQAANSLLDRGGLATAKTGPTVAVQVNVNGQQVQTLIREIWEAKQRRSSDIEGPMSDANEALEAEAHDPVSAAGEAPDRGGDQAQGPVPGSSSIPPLLTAQGVDSAGGFCD